MSNSLLHYFKQVVVLSATCSRRIGTIFGMLSRRAGLSSSAGLSCFTARCATQSVVLLRQVVRPPVRDVEVSWSHRLEYCEDNFTAS